MPKHPQITIQVGERMAPVDEQIAPLLLELWRAELDTLNSCQDNDGKVWIEFADVEHAETFLNAIGRFEEPVHSLYNRMSRKWVPPEWEQWVKDEAWEYDAHVWDRSVVEELDENGDCTGEHATGPANFRFSLSLRFPHRDLEEVLQRMTQFNSRKGND
ncbi:MAG: hypothetical protein M3Y56_15090 [Armatimonadota bacterium]|nr:hypothetical protein [Armatimonadota bacterium]